VHNIVSNVKVLLRYAILSMTESIRNDPERFRSIFNNKSTLPSLPSNKQQSRTFQRATAANRTHIEKEEHIFIESEIDNEEQDNQRVTISIITQ
jgi:hypothetical protein